MTPPTTAIFSLSLLVSKWAPVGAKPFFPLRLFSEQIKAAEMGNCPNHFLQAPFPNVIYCVESREDATSELGVRALFVTVQCYVTGNNAANNAAKKSRAGSPP